jgi:hypothetical protein
MVARVDNIANLKEEDLKPNLEFPFTLLCQMCWSKNVMEEADAPDQILIGLMDRRYCILLALAFSWKRGMNPHLALVTKQISLW